MHACAVGILQEKATQPTKKTKRVRGASERESRRKADNSVFETVT